MKLSVIITVFAEDEVIREVVFKLIALAGEKILEIIIIDSPVSPQKTKSICKDLSMEIDKVKIHTQVEYPGNGAAYREGFEMALGTHILMFDGDGEMEPETVPLLIQKIEETGSDIVVASRWARGGGAIGYDPVKYVLNRSFQSIFRIFFRTEIHDLTFGFKLMKSDVAKQIKWESRFQEIGAETTMKPIKAGFRAQEIPTMWKKRGTGISTNNFLRNFKYVKFAVRILFMKPSEIFVNKNLKKIREE